MIELLLLLTWVGIGVASAVALAPRGPGRLAWAPVAAVLGPLWPAVASEQARARVDSENLARESFDR